ncbi:MAG: Na+/H+ antiporter subunit D [Gemmatimonadetes bacterium]|nr:Na+/H+ antiporter subunit D [Gemmatimonadota bacterium]
MSNLIAFTVLIPVLTAVAVTPFENRRELQRRIAIVGGVLLLGLGLGLLALTANGDILVLPLGRWSPLVGIVWVVDLLSAILLALAALTSLATLFYAPGGMRDERETRLFYLLHQLLLVGINGSFVTGDFFNLFVMFEIMLLSSFVLISLGARARQLNQTFPYVLVNLVASALFLGGIGAVYGTAGTVNMAELGQRVAAGGLPAAFWASLALVLFVFAVKAALLPLFFWLPDSYPQSPIPVNALFAGLLTKVGIYTLFRSVPLVTGSVPTGFHTLLIFLAAGTMLIGMLGALGRPTIRGILSFQIVSSVGYIIFGLAIYTPVALGAAIFYTVHSIVVTTALFFAGGLAERVGGTDSLGSVRGMARTHPWVAVGFFIPAVALAGLPPFSGFWGKLFLLIGGFGAGAYAATTIALFVGLLTLGAMLKIWTSAFWGAPEGQKQPRLGHDRAMVGATLTLASLSVVIGLAAGPLWRLSERTAVQLLAVTPYVEAVLTVDAVGMEALETALPAVAPAGLALEHGGIR